jgi:hypothetical protein
VTWASATPSVATISASGVATGVATGTSTISATLGGMSGQTVLTVAPAALLSIVVTPAKASLTQGDTESFTATGTYSDNSTQDLTSQVTWASATASVATIDKTGLATSVAPGTATISATLGSISGQTALTVTPAPTPTPTPTPTSTPTPTPTSSSTSPVTVTSFGVERVQISKKPHAPKALALGIGFSGALNQTAAQNLAAYTVFSGKVKKINKQTHVIYNSAVPLGQAIYFPASNTLALLPRGKRTLPKLEQLRVNVSVLTDPMGRPIDNGKNFTATVTSAGLIISTSPS